MFRTRRSARGVRSLAAILSMLVLSLLLLSPLSAAPAGSQVVTIPLVEERVSLSELPLFAVTVLIAFVDGFNPCSLWVLSFLLGIVIHSGSRRKTVLVGITFLLVTAGVYGAFIVGVINVFAYVGFMTWIRVSVALLATAVAAVNIKDYFAFGHGPSLTISERRKTSFYHRLRKIMQPRRSGLAIAGTTAALALGIALAELPCTAGFPVMWGSIIAAQQIGTISYGLLVFCYLLVYLSIEIVLFVSVALTLRIGRLEERHGRVLKLFGGVIMLLLAVAMVARPEMMQSFSGTAGLFAASLAVTLAVIWTYRIVQSQNGGSN